MNGRNLPCLCGSGKKRKKCCWEKPMVMPVDEKPEAVKTINQNGLNSLLWKLIATAGGRITVPLTDITKTPHDAKIYSKLDEEKQSVDIWVDEPVIVTSEKRIIT